MDTSNAQNAETSEIQLPTPARRHARTNIHIHWPMAAASQCDQWLREVLA